MAKLPMTIGKAAKALARGPMLAAARASGRVIKPLFIDFAVTWRCNARCAMCDTWQAYKDPEATPAEELTLEQVRAIFARDAGFLAGLQKIGLTGGEPFLRKDIVEIIRCLHGHFPGARMSLVSNGLLTERIQKRLAEIREFFPELVFSVSLDGLGEVHDKVRGIPGAYQKAMATMQGALDLGFTVTSGATISKVNYDQILPLSQKLAAMGVDFSCNLTETGENFHNQDMDLELTAEQKDKIAGDLALFGHHYYMDQVRRQLLGEKRTLPCYAGQTSYFLTPTGDVTLCNIMGDPLGNLKERSFEAIASGPAAAEARSRVPGCTCWSQCEVKNSAATAPWHLAKWWVSSPKKIEFLKRYLGR